MSARLLELIDRLIGGVTVRSASAEFGPSPASRYPELLPLSDGQLMSADRAALLAVIRQDRANRRVKVSVR